MAKATRATAALEKAGAAFTVHSYHYDPDADRIGMQAFPIPQVCRRVYHSHDRNYCRPGALMSYVQILCSATTPCGIDIDVKLDEPADPADSLGAKRR